jgi:hypothetical protein
MPVLVSSNPNLSYNSSDPITDEEFPTENVSRQSMARIQNPNE